MKKELQLIPIPYDTEEWHKFRLDGIGASEMATVLYMNEWNTAARLYHEKIGSIPQQREDKEIMFHGRNQEDYIAHLWQYWDGTIEGMMDNYKAEKIVRRCRRINGYLVNPDYPWIFASLDRAINIEGGVNMKTGQALLTEAPLELKTLSGFSARKWEERVPMYYYIQVHTQMLVIDSDYAEIAMLQDGNRFMVEYIERDNDLCNRIIDISKSFWEERVVPGKKAVLMRDNYDKKGLYVESEQNQEIIDRLEPEPDSTQAYKEFMAETYLKERQTLKGDKISYEICRQDEMLKCIVNTLNKRRDYCKNSLIKVVRDNNVEEIDFDTKGKFTWSERANSKIRVALINIKDKPLDADVEKEVGKIDLKY
ncbi:YqaJ viral recombinase family protein [Patescibacteria group bacterium]|uniref:Putative exonuclease n=1 Tax=viral metagenome TaxID=1070528 RepID=A0A6M3M4L8_9ZZZZ|nr:YqaJ viral recombinase family protein [Patescibacteria group bacterium]MBU0846798.1 YqaJ viral recombinase family protein [Patescibacteria group bacterium]